MCYPFVFPLFNNPLKPFVIYWLNNLCLGFLIFKFIYRFQIIIPCQTNSWQWFLFFCRLCLCLLIASLALQKLLNFRQSLLSVLGTVPCTVGVHFSESHLHFKVFPVFYSCSFRFFSLILRPSVCFYTDVCTERCGIKFILFYSKPFSQCYLLKLVAFIQCMSLIPLSKIRWL